MESWQLKQMQSLPLQVKILKTQQRIREWYDAWEGQVYVSFSGGKDSTVLLKLVRELYPDVTAVFIDTGLEYPEIRKFVKTIEGVITIRPNMSFSNVIAKYGYPVISKEQSLYLQECRESHSEKLRAMRMNGSKKGYFKISEKYKYLLNAPFKISNKCCKVMKKDPIVRYEKESEKHPILGLMADESNLRKTEYKKRGCNVFDIKHPKSTPMGFWTEQDVLQYLKSFNVPYASIYGDIIDTPSGLTTTGVHRTGCMFCMYGVHLEKGENRFQKMARTHPKQYEYCIKGGEFQEEGWAPDGGLGMSYVLDYMGISY